MQSPADFIVGGINRAATGSMDAKGIFIAIFYALTNEANSRVQPAPQLLGLLRAWPNIVGPSFARIPPTLFAVIDGPWSLVPSPSEKEGIRQAVGDRAEAYSYYLLRFESICPTSVVWVSRDDQGLGYDIEDRSAGRVHRVEVKGSQGKDVRFLLTAHEHDVAHQDPRSYEVHFWGEINLNRRPDVEFNTLRERGFPLRFQDLASHLADERLLAIPTRYLVTRGAGSLAHSEPLRERGEWPNLSKMPVKEDRR